MLIDDPRFRRVVEAGIAPLQVATSARSRLRPVTIAAVLFGAAFTIGMQVLASAYDVRGPFVAVAQDLFSTPRSSEVYFAGLAIALVGMTNRVRIFAAAAAVLLQFVFVAERLLRNAPFALGDGPLYVLFGLAGIAVFWWKGEQRQRALKALSIGLVIPLATKLGYTWLLVSASARPRVDDQYLRVADHALGNPSWVVGQVLEFLGPVASGIVHVVYIELPLAAMAVAVYQLLPYAKGIGAWPRHYIVRTFVVIAFIGPLFYMLFPVVGPAYAFGPLGHGFALNNSWPSQVTPPSFHVFSFEFDNFTPRNCMPSLHTAWALAIFLHTRRGPVWLRYGGTFWLLATLTATLGFGYHYGVDLIAGAVLTLTIETALRDPQRGWDAARIQLVAFGSGMFALLLVSYRYLPLYFAEHPFVFGPLLLASVAGMGALFYGQFFAENGTKLAAFAGQPVRG
ncbi:MAG: phosphatase PAP2 family protein [Nocardiaceae bacterium]|nr:phosphatase PAP2 family protein [Nocardiaceae bacterium]